MKRAMGAAGVAVPFGAAADAPSGVTLIEVVTIVVVVGLLAGVLGPKFLTITEHQRVNEAVAVVAADLNQTVSLAARRQRPVVIAATETPGYTVRDRATPPADTIRILRNFGAPADLQVQSVNFSISPVVVFPNGTTSQALTITVSGHGFHRSVTLSPAGVVRVVSR